MIFVVQPSFASRLASPLGRRRGYLGRLYAPTYLSYMRGRFSKKSAPNQLGSASQVLRKADDASQQQRGSGQKPVLITSQGLDIRNWQNLRRRRRIVDSGVPDGTATITGNSRIVAIAISVPRREKSRVAANTPTKFDLDIENSAPKFTASARFSGHRPCGHLLRMWELGPHPSSGSRLARRGWTVSEILSVDSRGFIQLAGPGPCAFEVALTARRWVSAVFGRSRRSTACHSENVKRRCCPAHGRNGTEPSVFLPKSYAALGPLASRACRKGPPAV